MLKDIIFVDFFDTIMFRHVHPHTVTMKWANNICKKYNLNITGSRLVKYRNICFKEIEISKGEVIYDEAVELIYNKIIDAEPTLINSCSAKEFVLFAKNTELALEMAVQYPNTRLLKKLYSEKLKGKKIYVVSDFYLGKNDLELFCKDKEIDLTIFDDIFVSSEFGCQKSNGTLYEIVLSKIEHDGKSISMIGDNPISDSARAKEKGIYPVLRRRLIHKIELKIKTVIGYNYSNHVGRLLTKKCYKSGHPFSEYITIFFSFTERLKKIIPDNEKIVFLSREGYLLEKLFKLYDYYVIPKDNETKTHYYMCSRRSIASTNEESVWKFLDNKYLMLKHFLLSCGFNEEEIFSLARKYEIKDSELEENPTEKQIELLTNDIKAKISDNKSALLKYTYQELGNLADYSHLNIVDIGWQGSMQKGIEAALGIKTKGYYLGITGEDNSIHRNGIIFSDTVEKGYKTYSDILKTNIQLYEMLCAAPHGSAQTYRLVGENVEIPVEWVENEKNLYYKEIENWQENGIRQFIKLASWKANGENIFSNKDNANVVMKSALFANRERLDFLKELDKGFVWNFGRNVKGAKYSTKGVKLNLSIFYSPEKYLRYFAKVQRLLPRNNVIMFIYMGGARLYTLYTKVILTIKGAK